MPNTCDGGVDRVEEESACRVPLPGSDEFRAILAYEFALAVESSGNLAVVYVDVPECASDRRQEIGMLLRSITGRLCNVFLFSPSCFALLLSKTGPAEAAKLSLVVLNLLRINFPENLIRINLAAYPQIVQSLEGFDALAPGCGLPLKYCAPVNA